MPPFEQQANMELTFQALIANAINSFLYVPISDHTFMKVYLNKNEGSIVFEDSGAGMSPADMHTKLSNKFTSETQERVDLMYSEKNWNMIEDTNLGFAAMYLVAYHVELRSKLAGAGAYIWSSPAGGPYTVSACHETSEDVYKHGTKVTLYLNDINVIDNTSLEYSMQNHSRRIGFEIKVVTRTKERADRRKKHKSDTKTPLVQSEPEWIVRFSRHTGCKYYVHVPTLTSTYDLPQSASLRM